ncbi:hypothetical protein BGZ81_011142 [Podila clonocystis]|nr:hypothetical protein BGZ81_011142 [Podila clonocystis]
MKFNTAVVAFVVMVAPAMAAKTWDVSVLNGMFSPQELDIAPGDTVRWPNNDGGDHAIVETVAGARSCNNKAGGFNSGRKTKGQAYQRVFPTATVVNYKDGIGSNCARGATGTIYVGPRPSGAPPSGSPRPATSGPGGATRTAAPISTPTPTNAASTVEKSMLLGVACFVAALLV